jgi:phosphatidylserine/phosphatidylglycerophosphate/cardiolipin synthase-like enzyme
MDRIITGIHLPSELCSLIENAEENIYIVCPFIELHHHFKRALKKHQSNDKIKIVVLFGKFTNNNHYKLIDEDSDFLKSFPNIVIKYHHRLHAKFYANEKNALVTSLNMNHSSHNNNLEYGINIDIQTSPLARDLFQFIDEILNESELIFERLPEGKKSSDFSIVGKIDKFRESFPKAYERWTPADDARLEKLFCDKKSIDEIARTFQRQTSAIRARINKLELYEKYAL